MSSIIETVLTNIENDAVAAEKWVVAEVTGLEAEIATAIALPFWRAIEPMVMQDLEKALEAVLSELGTVALTYLTGGSVSVAEILAELLNKAEVIGAQGVVQLEPYALQAWLALKTLAVKAEADVAAQLAKL